MSFRRKLYTLLEPAASGHAESRALDVFLLTNIAVSVASYIMETIPALNLAYGSVFQIVDRTTVCVFTVEYVLRLWTICEDVRFRAPIWGRIRYMKSGMAIVDALAIAPLLLELLDVHSLRVLRLLRLVRILKVTRYMKSMQLIHSVIVERRRELVSSFVFMLFLLLASSSIMYEIESAIQPDKFSSIPATMWWSVASLTTMGYGDIYPISPIGKFLAGIVAVLGIGIFAIPTGIIAAGFVEKLGRRGPSDNNQSQ